MLFSKFISSARVQVSNLPRSECSGISLLLAIPEIHCLSCTARCSARSNLVRSFLRSNSRVFLNLKSARRRSSSTLSSERRSLPVINAFLCAIAIAPEASARRVSVPGKFLAQMDDGIASLSDKRYLYGENIALPKDGITPNLALILEKIGQGARVGCRSAFQRTRRGNLRVFPSRSRAAMPAFRWGSRRRLLATRLHLEFDRKNRSVYGYATSKLRSVHPC